MHSGDCVLEPVPWLTWPLGQPLYVSLFSCSKISIEGISLPLGNVSRCVSMACHVLLSSIKCLSFMLKITKQTTD